MRRMQMEHRQLRVILNRNAEIPEDVRREGHTIDWASALYLNAMRIAAAGALVERDSLEKAASLLWWAGFTVPPGYFSEDAADELEGLDDEKTLRAWVERDEENIRRAFESIGFYLAGTGALMEPKVNFPSDKDVITEEEDWRREHEMMD
jgi:hypothetical protein